MSCDAIKTAVVIYRLKWKFSILKHLDDIQSPRLILQSSLTTDSFENQIPSSRTFIRTFSWQEIPSRIVGTIFLPIIQKIRHYSENESYLTKWYTLGFRNIRLVSIYSKSVSRENSKCVYFVSVQMKNIVQNRPFFSHYKQNEKMSHIWYNGIPKAFTISNQFPFIQSQWAMKIPNVFILRQYR